MEPNLIKISPDRKKIFQQSMSIVVKVGSSLIVEDKLGAIKKQWFALKPCWVRKPARKESVHDPTIC